MRGMLRLPVVGPNPLVCLGLLGCLGSACGPISYLSRATFGASQDIEVLRGTDAPEMAPYEWTAATENLRRSQELAGYARFQDANKFAKSAQDNAANAKKVRDRRVQNQELPIYKPGDKTLFITQDGVVKRRSGSAAETNPGSDPQGRGGQG